ncbi:MAG TPA: hypothetical protein VLV25_06290 [Steroidobacteraceae bacterium]|nr:hypothetical protein [Steroidobacteraceae bacterium]
MARGVLPLKRGVVPKLVLLVAMAPPECRRLRLELRCASCLVARRFGVLGVFLFKPHRLMRRLPVEISKPAIRGGEAAELLVCCVLDLVLRGGERLRA